MNNKGSNWPSAAVAIALILLVAIVMVTAISRYDVDGALKVWSALGTLIGVLTGAVVTYFLTRATVGTAQKQEKLQRERANTAQKALDAIRPYINQADLDRIRQADPRIRQILGG